jgi:hypothetical protein
MDFEHRKPPSGDMMPGAILFNLKEVSMRPRTFTLLAIAVSVLVLGSIAQAADNQAGTWKLNVAKSK